MNSNRPRLGKVVNENGSGQTSKHLLGRHTIKILLQTKNTKYRSTCSYIQNMEFYNKVSSSYIPLHYNVA